MRLILGFVLTLACAMAAPAPAVMQPPAGHEFFFAATPIGRTPEGWFVPTPGYAAVAVADEQAPGGRAVELARGPVPVRGFGNFMQSIDATPYRGKRIKLTGIIRSVADQGAVRSQMWLRVDRQGDQVGFFDNMADRPITAKHADAYHPFSITGSVSPDAQRLSFGVMLMGLTGSVRIASISIDTVGEAIEADRPAAALDGRALHNVTAFAEAYGLVRFFHPSDQSKGVDWDRLAIAGAERAERAKNAAELAAALNEIFQPIAPTAVCWEGDEHAPAPKEPAVPPEATRVTVWQHVGVQLVSDQAGLPNIYRSSRLTEALSTPADERKLPPLGAAAVQELAGGVWIRVPIAVPTDDQGRTLPREVQGKVPGLDRPEGWLPTGNDRGVRIGAVIVAWTTLEHFYPYFDVVDADWPAALPAALSRAARDPDGTAFLTTLRTLVARLHDGHGYVNSPAAGGPSPLPVEWAWVGASLVVTVPDPAGRFQRGDIVESIDGRPVDQWYERLLPSISAATDQWARWRALTELRQIPPEGGKTRLTVRRGDSQTSIELARTTNDPQPKPEPRPASGAELAPGIVYFNLDGATGPQLDAAMEKLAAAKGIVFDLRGYPGDAGMLVLQHLATAPIQSAKWNVPIVTWPDRDKWAWRTTGRWNLPPKSPHLGGPGQPVAFVTDGRAISYAESCMGIVEAYKLGEIVGGPTAGTNGNINPLVVPGGYRIIWTGMKVVKHDDSKHHGVGIAPTVPAHRTQEGIAAGKDELLDAAVEAVRKKLPSK